MKNRRFMYGHVSDVHGPHLVLPGDLQVTQQVGELVLCLVRHRGTRHAVHCLDAHGLHEPAHLVAPDHHTLLLELIRQPTCTSAGILHMQFIHQAHNAQVFFAHRSGRVVESAAVHLQHLTSPHAAQLLVPRFDRADGLGAGAGGLRAHQLPEQQGADPEHELRLGRSAEPQPEPPAPGDVRALVSAYPGRLEVRWAGVAGRKLYSLYMTDTDPLDPAGWKLLI